MKRFILITNSVATALFVWFILFMGTDDAAVGAFGFIIFIIPFLLIMGLVNITLYVIFRVSRSKEKVRSCPACGSKVKVGITLCAKCAFDFFRSASTNERN